MVGVGPLLLEPDTKRKVGYLHEPQLRRRDAPRREYERRRDRMIVQVRPRYLFFQLAQTVRSEVEDSEFIVRLGRVRAELPVEQPRARHERRKRLLVGVPVVLETAWRVAIHRHVAGR